MDKSSEAILALKPATFHYKNDSKGTPQFGLIAEEVAEVNPDLVVCDEKGEIYSARYDQVNAMLLNEFLKEHRKVEQLTKDFESKLGEQQKQIEALSAGLQKVSAEVEMSRAANGRQRSVKRPTRDRVYISQLTAAALEALPFCRALLKRSAHAIWRSRPRLSFLRLVGDQ